MNRDADELSTGVAMSTHFAQGISQGPSRMLSIHHVPTSDVGAVSLDVSSVADAAAAMATTPFDASEYLQKRTPTPTATSKTALLSGDVPKHLAAAEPVAQMEALVDDGESFLPGRSGNAVRPFEYPIDVSAASQQPSRRMARRHRERRDGSEGGTASATSEEARRSHSDAPQSLSGDRPRRAVPSHNTSAMTDGAMRAVWHAGAPASLPAFALVELARRENYLRQLYNDKLKGSVQSVMAALAHELPRDHVYIQLLADPTTEQYCKIRVGEVVETFLFSVQAHQYHTLAAELAKRETEVLHLTSQLENVASDLQLIEAARDEEEARMTHFASRVTALTEENKVLKEELARLCASSEHSPAANSAGEPSVVPPAPVGDATRLSCSPSEVTNTAAADEHRLFEFLQEVAREHELARNRECVSLLTSLVALGRSKSDYGSKFEYIADINSHLFRGVLSLTKHVTASLADSAMTPVKAARLAHDQSPLSETSTQPMPSAVVAPALSATPTKVLHRSWDLGDRETMAFDDGSMMAVLFRKHFGPKGITTGNDSRDADARGHLQRQRIAGEAGQTLQQLEQDLMDIQRGIDHMTRELAQEHSQLLATRSEQEKRIDELKLQIPQLEEVSAKQLLLLAQQQETTLRSLRAERHELIDRAATMEAQLLESRAKRDELDRAAQQELLVSLVDRVSQRIDSVSARPLTQLVEQIQGLERRLEEQREALYTQINEAEQDVLQRDQALRDVVACLTLALGAPPSIEGESNAGEARSAAASLSTASLSPTARAWRDPPVSRARPLSAQHAYCERGRSRSTSAGASQSRDSGRGSADAPADMRADSYGSVGAAATRCDVCKQSRSTSERVQQQPVAANHDSRSRGTAVSRKPARERLEDPGLWPQAGHDAVAVAHRAADALQLAKKLLQSKDQYIDELQRSISDLSVSKANEHTDNMRAAAAQHAQELQTVISRLTAAHREIADLQLAHATVRAELVSADKAKVAELAALAAAHEKVVEGHLRPRIGSLEHACSDLAAALEQQSREAKQLRDWFTDLFSAGGLAWSSLGATRHEVIFLEAVIAHYDAYILCGPDEALVRLRADFGSQLESQRRGSEAHAGQLSAVVKAKDEDIARAHERLQEVVTAHSELSGTVTGANAAPESLDGGDPGVLSLTSQQGFSALRSRYAALPMLSGAVTAVVMLVNSLGHQNKELTRQLHAAQNEVKMAKQAAASEVDEWRSQVEEARLSLAKQKREFADRIQRLEGELAWLGGHAAEKGRQEMQALLRQQEAVLDTIGVERNELQRRWLELSAEYQRLERRNSDLHRRCVAKERENSRLLEMLRSSVASGSSPSGLARWPLVEVHRPASPSRPATPSLLTDSPSRPLHTSPPRSGAPVDTQRLSPENLTHRMRDEATTPVRRVLLAHGSPSEDTAWSQTRAAPTSHRSDKVDVGVDDRDGGADRLGIERLTDSAEGLQSMLSAASSVANSHRRSDASRTPDPRRRTTGTPVTFAGRDVAVVSEALGTSSPRAQVFGTPSRLAASVVHVKGRAFASVEAPGTTPNFLSETVSSRHDRV